MGKLKMLLAGAALGLINSAIFVVFEWIVNEGTEFIWNDFFNTSANRWAVVPVAIVLGILYSWVIKVYKQKRLGNSETNILKGGNPERTNLKSLGAIFVIGALSLLAGASLGPEASLAGIASGLGIWFSQKTDSFKAAQLLSISSLGALLVAFFGSLIPISIPLLMIYKKQKRFDLSVVLVPIVTGVFSYIGLFAIKGAAIGFGSIPVGPGFVWQDLIFALVLGILGSFMALILKKLISSFEKYSNNIDRKNMWIVSAAIFGLTLGIFYLVGGETVQFSGKEGTELILQNPQIYGVGILLIIFLAKLLATAWSLGSGYRGGIVFPSVFMGVAISVLFEEIHPILTGPGIMIGSITGIMAALLSPVVGFILVLSMIPVQLIGVALAGLLGAIVGNKVISKLKFIGR